MIKTFCDNCGAETARKGETIVQECEHVSVTAYYLKNSDSENCPDLCRACQIHLLRLLIQNLELTK